LVFFSACPQFRCNKQHSRLAYVPRKSGGIALINGACHVEKGHRILAQMLICRLLARLRTPNRDPGMPPMHAQYTLSSKLYGSFFICFLLGSMVARLLVPYTSRERSCDMVLYNCLDSLSRTETNNRLSDDCIPLT
jgi:hypothetical protein